MLILFDNGTPGPLRHALKGHVVVEAIERGWDPISNGELIAAAEAANQQWPTLRRYVDRVVAAVNTATPGGYIEVDIPFE
jgi:hypothetical protein